MTDVGDMLQSLMPTREGRGVQVFHRSEKRLHSVVRGGLLAGSVGVATLMALLVLPAAPAKASPSIPIVEIVMENTSYSQIVGNPMAPFINGTMIAGGLSFTNYFDNTDGSLHNYLAMTDGDIATSHAPAAENIFHQLQNSGASWAAYEESMPSACYTGTSSGTVPGSTDGLYVKIHNPAMQFNNINGDPFVCNARVLPLTSTFDPNALPAFSYVVPNNCNNMHTQSKNGTANAPCPAYFGSNGAADKITMADNWLATFVPAVASKATVILTWDEGSATSPQQIVTLEYGLGVSNGTNNSQFNHFNLLGGLETFFGVPLINGAIGRTPLPIPSTPSPTITSFTPTSGPVGTVVTITGTNFTSGAVVKFNGVAGTGFVFKSPTKVKANVPAGATTGPISITTAGGTATSSTPFTVPPPPPPTITSFTPTSGAEGTVVTITGTNFTSGAVVTFNGLTAGGFQFMSATTVKASAPTGATTGPISITTAGGTATSSTPFTVTPPPPTITSFTPTSGPVGTVVTITGTNFTPGAIVKFNGLTVSAFQFTSVTTVKAKVPAGATTGPISVTTAGGTATSSTPFTVT